LPTVLALHPNFPNPFNPETTIGFDIPAVQDRARLAQRVRLRIYNTLGQQVRSLADTPYKPGTYTAYWDGRDDQGHIVASGVYFYRLETNSSTQTRRLTLIR
jgi:flagellar hook assembly protein FlgD